jgi:hypothetical protein
MSQDKKERKAGSNIILGLVCLILGVPLLNFDYLFWAWFLFSIGAFGLITGILQSHLGYSTASNVGSALTLLVVTTGIYINIITKTRTTWILALSWFGVITLILLAGFGLSSLFKASGFRILFRSLGLIFFSLSLLLIYHFLVQRLFPFDVILIFMAVDSLRRGLYELFTGKMLKPSEDATLFFLPDLFILVLLISGLVYYRDWLFFHMIIVSLVLGLFRFSTEHFIPEIAERERRKIDKEHPKQNYRSSISFFGSLTGTHSSINLVILPLLLGFLYLSLNQYVIKSDIQGNVFQVSIGLIGIIVAFTALILSQRLRRHEEGWGKQTYLLRGLLGITFLFVIITMISFLGASLKEVSQQVDLLEVNHIVAKFLTNPDVQLQVIAVATNEFVFFAIPASLLYFYSLNRDLTQQQSKED